MSISMHTASVQTFVRLLKNLIGFLDKAEAYAKERGFDVNVLVTSRLAPDMHPLSFQVQTATDQVKGCLARLSGQEIPSWADDEKTVADLKARAQKAIDYAESFAAADIDASGARTVTIKMAGKDTEMDGQNYLLRRVLPNVYFHVTTAYDILRHNGVPVGKRDFMAN